MLSSKSSESSTDARKQKPGKAGARKPADSDLPAGTGGRQVLLAGTDWGNNNVTRPELHHVLGDNWDSNPDEDWFGVDL